MARLVEEPGLQAWRVFLQAHTSVISRIEAELKRRDLIPLTWYDVLVAISSAPERRIRMSALSRELVLTRSGATRLVDKLEAAGLVRRETADEDHRGAVAVLTPAGRAMLRKAWPVYARGINDLFLSNLSTREVDTIARALNRIWKAAGTDPTLA